MVLLKNGAPAENIYTDVSESESLPDAGAIIVSLDQWQKHRSELENRQTPLGIILRSHEKPAVIQKDLKHFDLIALEFPAFRDGRAYSYARLLRERYHFDGELRAVGDVLLEQLHFMHRVGFNAFAVRDQNAVKAWTVAAADISVWYQPTSDGRQSALELRHPK